MKRYGVWILRVLVVVALLFVFVKMLGLTGTRTKNLMDYEYAKPNALPPTDVY